LGENLFDAHRYHYPTNTRQDVRCEPARHVGPQQEHGDEGSGGLG
jgi:hypothetical protein